MTIHQKVTLLIEALDLNVNSFSKQLGISTTSIQNIVGDRKSKPSFDLLSKIITTFDVNPDWIFFNGDHEMFRKSKSFEFITIYDPEPEKNLRRQETINAEDIEGEFQKLWNEIGSLKEKFKS